MKYYYIIFLVFLTSCKTGKLQVLGDISSSLTEVSALETIPNSDLLWVIEDSDNKNILYGLNLNGSIIKSIKITNGKNKDWEDLTSDTIGNLYIGDFGNNNKKRKQFRIYKVSNVNSTASKTTVDTISFRLPKNTKSLDFEAFFLWENAFYVFSKDDKTCQLFKIPNISENHIAELISTYKFDGENNKITSADISDNGKTVVLLTHDKIWKLSDFETDDFFSGKVEAYGFNHDSQKEGVCFKDINTLYISDEKTKLEGGNLYEFYLN